MRFICTFCITTALFRASREGGGEEMLSQLIPHQSIPSKFPFLEQQAR